jgi:hypothetical protein
MDIIIRICTVGVRVLTLSFKLQYLYFKKCYAMKIMGRDFEKNVDFVAFLFINFHRRTVYLLPSLKIPPTSVLKKL